MKVKDLLDKEEKWIKGSYSKHALVESTTPKGDKIMLPYGPAIGWCLLGAIGQCYGLAPSTIRAKVEAEIRGVYNTAIVEWNDAPERTFADIRQLVEKLDI